MKALTISQPFASLIADGDKWVENRKWPTNYRGLLAIHAGKGKQYLTASELSEYPTGKVIAIATLVNCLELTHLRRMDRWQLVPGWPIDSAPIVGAVLDHDHTEGPWCWILRDVKKLSEPITINGAQGLWDWSCPRFVTA